MKTLLFSSLLLCLSFTVHNSFAQDAISKETITVWGNCGMCEKKIETAALQAGASSADWNAKKKLLKVSYDPAKTSNAAIQQAIAHTGYDTQDFTASQDAYDNLHGCCKYDRKAQASSGDFASCCHAGKPCKDKENYAGNSCCSQGKVCKDSDCCKNGACTHKAGKDDATSCCKDGKTCSDHASCSVKGCCSSALCCKS